jgi:adenylate cyclase
MAYAAGLTAARRLGYRWAEPPAEPGMIGADAPTIGTEIERKFLLRRPGDGPAVVEGLAGIRLLQGYFRDIDGWSVRLRCAPGKAWLTLKSRDGAATRREIETPVEPETAARLLALLPPDQRIGKTRYRRPVDGAPGLVWEIDCFEGRHDGLWLVEVELPRADHPLALPDWLGAEVTADPRYRNAALAATGQGGDSSAPLPDELDQLARRLLAAPPAPSARAAGRHAERSQRQARLERQLRANLLRRKQQLRGRDETGAAADAAPEPGPALDRDDPAT